MTATVDPRQLRPLLSRNHAGEQPGRVKSHGFANGFVALIGKESPAGREEGSSARVFNADGFFGRLQSRLASSSKAAPETSFECAPDERERTAASLSLAFPLEPLGVTSVPCPSACASHAEAAIPNQAKSIRTRPAAELPLVERKAQLQAAEASMSVANQDVGANEKAGLSASFAALRPSASDIRITCSAGVIHIAGRIGGLSNDEKQQLIEQVAQLLVEHGLTPSDIKLNGQLVGPIAQKGE